METSKTSKAADTAAGADTKNAGFSRECKCYGSWKIFIFSKEWCLLLISNELKGISKTSKKRKRKRKKPQKDKGISVQQISWIFCCIQHTLRRQDISYGSLCVFLKLRKSIISRQLFLRCLCLCASYSSWLLNVGPVAATGCSTRAEKPTECPRGHWRVMVLEESEAKPSQAQGCLLCHWQGATGRWGEQLRVKSQASSQIN